MRENDGRGPWLRTPAGSWRSEGESSCKVLEACGSSRGPNRPPFSRIVSHANRERCLGSNRQVGHMAPPWLHHPCGQLRHGSSSSRLHPSFLVVRRAELARLASRLNSSPRSDSTMPPIRHMGLSIAASLDRALELLAAASLARCSLQSLPSCPRSSLGHFCRPGCVSFSSLSILPGRPIIHLVSPVPTPLLRFTPSADSAVTRLNGRRQGAYQGPFGGGLGLQVRGWRRVEATAEGRHPIRCP